MSQDLYRKVYPTSEVIPRFYGLPKVHKPDMPLRPIVSSIGSITYDVARWLADIIAPVIGKNEYTIRNSAHFVEMIKDLSIEDDEELVSYDVTALFTNTPVEEAASVIEDKLSHDVLLHERTDLTPSEIKDLVIFCLRATYFVFNDTIYQQSEGAAMGSPISPVAANAYMEHFEETALATCTSVNPPKFWARYVDDTCVVIQRESIEAFTHHLNSIHPRIKFTVERENNGTLPMLDTLIHRKDKCLYTTVFRKATHTDQYLSATSHHPLQHKLGVIRTLHHRAEIVSSKQEDLEKEKEHVNEALSRCGYVPWHFSVVDKKSRRAGERTRDRASVGSVTIPYIRGTSEALRRIFVKHGIQVHFKPRNTLRELLVAPKDRLKKDERTGAVYHIKCTQCDASYIGESERPLRARLAEHRRPSSVNSPVVKHVSESGHTINWHDVKVLDSEDRWFERGVRESIHIFQNSASLNRDGGRFHLPGVYKHLLRSQGDKSHSRPLMPPGGRLIQS